MNVDIPLLVDENNVPSTSSPVVGPPRFRKRTPTPLRSSEEGEEAAAVDGAVGVEGSEMPVAALNSVVRLSFLLVCDSLLFLLLFSEEEEAKSRVDIILSPLPSMASLLSVERDKTCRLAFGIKAVDR